MGVPNSASDHVGPPKPRAPIRPIAAAAAASIWLAFCAIASGQTGPGGADRYTAMIEGICRDYAAAITGMSVDLMFDQCMAERHCRISIGSATYWCEPPQPMSWHGGGY
jgi:hypothetical protein